MIKTIYFIYCRRMYIVLYYTTPNLTYYFIVSERIRGYDAKRGNY